jgi:hypothetical protein
LLFFVYSESEFFLTFLKEFSNAVDLGGNVVLKSLDDVELACTFLGLFIVLGHLDVAPDVLDAESLLLVFKSKSVVFEGISDLLDDVLVVDDGGFKESLSLGKSLVLLLQVSGLDHPKFSLLLLSFSEHVAGSDELLSDLAEEVEDLDDGLVVDLGGKLGKGGNEGLEEGVFAFSELGLDLLESGFDLREGDTSLQVLDDLGSIIDGFNLFLVLSILDLPGGVLLLTEGLFLGEGFLVVLDVLGGHTDLLLSLGEGVDGILVLLGESGDLGLVVEDLLLHVVDQLVAGGNVGLVNFVSFSLVTSESGANVVQKQHNLIDGGTSSEVELHH